MVNLQERGVLFVSPGEDCYEGMLVGENARAEDLDVNISKAKQMTNVRSNADVLVRLAPPRLLSLDQALEYIEEDECAEVTPDASGCARSSWAPPNATRSGPRRPARPASRPARSGPEKPVLMPAPAAADAACVRPAAPPRSGASNASGGSC